MNELLLSRQRKRIFMGFVGKEGYYRLLIARAGSINEHQRAYHKTSVLIVNRISSFLRFAGLIKGFLRFTGIIIWLFLNILNSTGSANAQTDPEVGLPFITNYSPKEYSAGQSNWAVVKDNRGVMYFANDNGVLEFDGASWRIILLTNQNYCRSLGKASDGAIYVGGVGDLGYLRADEQGQMNFVSLLPEIPEEYRQFTDVWSAHASTDGVYFRTDKYLFRWNGKQMKVWQSSNRYHVSEIIRGTYYLREWGVGLMRLENDSLVLVPDGERFASERIYVMLPYDNDHILIGTRTQGLFLYDGHTFEPFKTEADAFLAQNQLYLPGAVLPNGTIALGTFSGGLAVIDHDGRLLHILDKSKGLLDNAVDYIYPDPSGDGVWLALYKGISYLEIPSPLSIYGSVSGLEFPIFDIVRHKNILYAATNIGVFWLDKLTGSFKLIPGTADQCFDLLSVEDELYLAQLNLGLVRIDGTRATVVRRSVNYDYRANGIHNWSRNPDFLFVSLDDGIGVLKRVNNVWQDVSKIPVNTSVFAIKEDISGNLWTGSTSGVIRIKFDTNTLDDLSAIKNAEVEHLGIQYGLPAGLVWPTKIAKTVYFTSFEGLFVFDEESIRFMRDNTFSSVGINRATQQFFMTDDSQGRVWMNFGAETAVATPNKDGTYKIEKTPFLRFIDDPIFTIYPEENGIVWFGGGEAVIRYDGSAKKDYTVDYPALIRRVVIGEDSLIYGGTASTNISDKIALDYTHNSLRVEFAAPTYDNPKAIQYHSMLEGFDQRWSPWSSENKRDYTNLPSGYYKFRVQARNVYQHLSGEAIYEFEILPPWYSTWWAYFIYFLAAGGILFSVVRLRTRQLEVRHRELEKTVEDRTAEIQQKVNELAIINSVGSGLAKQLDFQAIIDLVGDKIHEIFHSPTIFIGLYDRITNLISFPYYLEQGERIHADAVTLGKGLTSHVIETRQPLLIVEDAERLFAELGAVYISEDEVPKKSWLGVPILMGTSITGVISLQDVKEKAFSDADVRLLSTLASNMGVALENARLFDETSRLLSDTEQRNAELAVINRVQEGLVAALDLQAIYNLIGDKIRELFDAQAVIIATFDHDAGLEHFRYTIEKGERFHPVPRPFEGVRRYLIEKRQMVLINENYKEAASQYGMRVVPGTEAPKSLLFVPMVVGETVIGYISLQNIDREHAFSDSDVRLLTTLANSMSVALENARLFDETNRLLKETEQRNAELAVINSVQDGLVAELDMQAIYDLVGDKIRDIFDAQAVIIGTFDHSANLEHFQYTFEKGERFYLKSRRVAGIRSYLIRTRQLVLINENYEKVVTEYGGPRVVPGTEVPKSLLFVPLVVGDTVRGYVSLQNIDREHAFSDSDVRLLTTLANGMSVALENARLFAETNRLLNETEQRNAELAVINSVQEGLVAALEMQDIYDMVGDKIRDIFDAQVVIVATFDHKHELEKFDYLFEKGERYYPEPREIAGIRKHLVRDRQLVLINENYEKAMEKYGGPRVVPGTEVPKSLLFMPLVVGNTVRGYISLQNIDREHAFSDSDIRLLTTLANSMSVALENARLFAETNRLLSETEQRNAELAVINSVQEGLVKELNTRAIYDLVGDRICTLFNIQAVVIRTFDHDSGLEYWQYAMEKGERLSSEPRPIIWANQELIRSKQPLIINENYLETSRKFGGSGVTVGRPPKSAVFVPMIVGDMVVGSISLQNVEHENAFSDSDVRLLATLSSSMSVALESARLFDETNRLLNEAKQRAAELATVNSISSALVSQLELDALIQLVGEQMSQLFNADIVYVALLDKKTNTINFPYQVGDDMSPLKLGEGLTSRIIKTKKPLLINKNLAQRHKEMGIATVGIPAASYLGVPIPVGNEVIGVISVQSTEVEGRFGEDDMHLLNTIAANVGVALQNANLFEETKQARAAAEEANEAKSAFLSTVSHELRTPLTSVLGFAKIIKKRLEEKIFPLIQSKDSKIQRTIQQVEDNLTVVVAEGERLTSLINNVLDLAKIEAGKIEWNMQTVNVPDIIERATAATSSLFDNSKVEFVTNVKDGLPQIVGDQDKLIQVVINLISNAIKFTEKGSVTCRSKLVNGEILISVSDTGMGISEEDLPKVFEKFKQVGDTLTNKPKGTGLGLTISKEIVEVHGGKIWVESKEGVGSTFFFTLPVKSKFKDDRELHPVDLSALMAQLKQRVESTAVSSKEKGLTILVVDDEKHIRELLKQELGEAGYHVQVAENGRDALETIRKQRPDLVILDVMMPEMNGFDVAAVLKNDPNTMDIPIIILSIVQDKERGFRLGIDRYLTKPIDTDLLFSEVGALLEQGKSKKKVMVVDEDTSTVKSLVEVLQTRGYHVVEANGPEMVKTAISEKPDIIILNSILSENQEVMKTLRFEKGLENVLFLVYQ